MTDTTKAGPAREHGSSAHLTERYRPDIKISVATDPRIITANAVGDAAMKLAAVCQAHGVPTEHAAAFTQGYLVACAEMQQHINAERHAHLLEAVRLRLEAHIREYTQ